MSPLSLPLLCQALRRPKIHRHSFKQWTTDCKPRFLTTHTSPPRLHHPPTTRPTTTTSSTNMLQIITRTRATKPSASNPQPSSMPQPPNTVAAHPSLSTTRASPPSPFPTNPSGTIPRLHPQLPPRRGGRGHFGRRFYSVPQSPHNSPNQTSNPDPPGLAVLPALRIDCGNSDHCRPRNRRRATCTFSSGRSWFRQRHGDSIPENESLPRDFCSCTVRRLSSRKPPGL